jgi:hypothetical protein
MIGAREQFGDQPHKYGLKPQDEEHYTDLKKWRAKHRHKEKYAANE